MFRVPSPRLITTPLTLLLTAAVFVGATPAHAARLGIACPTPTWTPFAAWHDYASYAAAPDGGLENGASGWTLSAGARIVRGNEPFAAGTHSLLLPAGSRATTPPMCIGLLSSKMRFFLRSAGASGARLRIQVVYEGGLGSLAGLFDTGSVKAGAAWAPSPPISMLGGIAPALTQSVRFRFTPLGSEARVRIDDVYLDPLIHR
ncbi:MAG TPA: hypothetical protein VFQ71_14390 [Gaiellales bacterium]|jgi:hypothetical protein|nr:hypothetical protein [Gaiellales bacterium]